MVIKDGGSQHSCDTMQYFRWKMEVFLNRQVRIFHQMSSKEKSDIYA